MVPAGIGGTLPNFFYEDDGPTDAAASREKVRESTQSRFAGDAYDGEHYA